MNYSYYIFAKRRDSAPCLVNFAKSYIAIRFVFFDNRPDTSFYQINLKARNSL